MNQLQNKARAWWHKARALKARIQVLWYLNKDMSDQDAMHWARIAKGHVYTVMHRGKYRVHLRHGLLIIPGETQLWRDPMPPEELAAAAGQPGAAVLESLTMVSPIASEPPNPPGRTPSKS
jgi:hypothetical protein